MSARSFLVPLSLNGLEIQNFRIQNLASAPGSPGAGQTYYDTSLGATYTYNGTTWVTHDATKATGIPNTALATNPLARANHTGTQLAITISDFATTAQSYRLDQFAVPTAAINFNSQKGTNVATPTTAGDVAEYSWVIGQVQSAAAGIASKPPVRVVAVANITLSGTQTIDGVSLLAGDRVLVTAQTTGSQNGVYNVASGAWTRTTVEGSTPGEIETGALWLATEGTLNAATQWRLATTGTLTIGTTSLSIVQFGASAIYTNGNGLNLSGGTFSVKPSTGITVGAPGVGIDTAVVVQKYSTSIGDGSATSIVVTHNLGTQDVNVAVRTVGSPYAFVECDIQATSTSTVTCIFAVAPTTNQYRVTVHG